MFFSFIIRVICWNSYPLRHKNDKKLCTIFFFMITNFFLFHYRFSFFTDLLLLFFAQVQFFCFTVIAFAVDYSQFLSFISLEKYTYVFFYFWFFFISVYSGIALKRALIKNENQSK